MLASFVAFLEDLIVHHHLATPIKQQMTKRDLRTLRSLVSRGECRIIPICPPLLGSSGLPVTENFPLREIHKSIKAYA